MCEKRWEILRYMRSEGIRSRKTAYITQQVRTMAHNQPSWAPPPFPMARLNPHDICAPLTGLDRLRLCPPLASWSPCTQRKCCVYAGCCGFHLPVERWRWRPQKYFSGVMVLGRWPREPFVGALLTSFSRQRRITYSRLPCIHGLH